MAVFQISIFMWLSMSIVHCPLHNLPVELLKSTLFGGSWMNTGPDRSCPTTEHNSKLGKLADFRANVANFVFTFFVVSWNINIILLVITIQKLKGYPFLVCFVFIFGILLLDLLFSRAHSSRTDLHETMEIKENMYYRRERL